MIKTKINSRLNGKFVQQPNALDVSLGRVFKLENTLFEISENDEKVHRKRTEIFPGLDDWFYLTSGDYDILLDGKIEVANDECALIIQRSSLNRNGFFITSGIYDSGYKGVLGCCLHVPSSGIKIQKGTRIGQLVIFSAESAKMYNGSYGTGKEFDKKFY